VNRRLFIQSMTGAVIAAASGITLAAVIAPNALKVRHFTHYEIGRDAIVHRLDVRIPHGEQWHVDWLDSREIPTESAMKHAMEMLSRQLEQHGNYVIGEVRSFNTKSLREMNAWWNA
jgi:hypothetical protein